MVNPLANEGDEMARRQAANCGAGDQRGCGDRRNLLTGVTLCLALVACGGDGGADTDALSEAGEATDAAHTEETEPTLMPDFEEMSSYGPHAVGVTTVTFVDATRVTRANGDHAEQEGRTLVTEIWYPATEGSPYTTKAEAPPASEGAPWPLVVHGHGFLSSRKDSPLLSVFLASHGYVVAAPDFPLTGRSAPGGANVLDGAEQPADMHFVAAQMLDGGAPAGLALDGARVVFSGVSLGGFSAIAAGLDPSLGPLPLAIVGMTPATCMLETELLDTSTPLMIVHGTADAILPFEAHAQRLYDAASAPKWLVALDRGTHTGFADITAALFAEVEHADSVGCDALAGTLPDPEDQEDLFAELGEDVLTPDCTPPCADDAMLVDGMETTRQALLTRVVVRAFLDAVVHEDAEAVAFVEHGIAASEDDVAVEMTR
jgi:predicted dienelactone hydrolase